MSYSHRDPNVVVLFKQGQYTARHLRSDTIHIINYRPAQVLLTVNSSSIFGNKEFPAAFGMAFIVLYFYC